MKNRIVAIVVTHNRKNLLIENIEALLSQQEKEFDILVVNNNSSDGTSETLRDFLKIKKIDHYIESKENLGGAGGFELGILEAIKYGYEEFWLMDDDTIPEVTAFKELKNADKNLKGRYGFLSSIVLWKEDEYCLMNKQKINKNWYEVGRILSKGLLPIYYATFVSFYIKLDTIKEFGLPIKEFFIWGDDVEYSTRITKKRNAFLVLKSVVKHKTITNIGSSIEKEEKEKIPRYFYAYRNEMYIAKRDGIKGILYQLTKILYHLQKILFSNKKNKSQKIFILLKGSIFGIFFSPKIKKVIEEKKNV